MPGAPGLHVGVIVGSWSFYWVLVAHRCFRPRLPHTGYTGRTGQHRARGEGGSGMSGAAGSASMGLLFVARTGGPCAVRLRWAALWSVLGLALWLALGADSARSAPPPVTCTADLAGRPGSPLVAPDGTIYLPVGLVGVDTAGYLYRFNADCTQRWRATLNILPSSTTPAIGIDGRIYVHGNGLGGNIVAIEKMHAINPSDGSIAWTYEFNGGAGIFTSSDQSTPRVAPDGTIYVGSIDTGLHAINPNGTLKWARYPGGSIESSPALAQDGTIYIVDVCTSL